MNEIYGHHPAIAWNGVGGKVTLIDPVENEVVYFNDLGSRIWQLLDGRTAAGRIVGILASEFDAAPEKIRKDVLRFLKTLKDDEFIVVQEEAHVHSR